MRIYYKVDLIYSRGTYNFNVTEMQADLFARIQKLDCASCELNKIYSIENEISYVYVEHEEKDFCEIEIGTGINLMEFEAEKSKKKKRLLFKAKNMLLNDEIANLNNRSSKLHDLQFDLKQKFNKL